MTVEKINEGLPINLASQKTHNIIIKADKNPLRTNIRSNAIMQRFYLTCPMKIKMFIFKNNEKTCQGRAGRIVELKILQLPEISGMRLLAALLEADPSLHCFCKLSLS